MHAYVIVSSKLITAKMVKRVNEDEALEKLTQESLQQFLARTPEEATFLGFHEPYDKLLSNGSIEEVYENLKLMEAWLAKLRKTINFDELNEEHKMDWKLLENACEWFRFSTYEHRIRAQSCARKMPTQSHKSSAKNGYSVGYYSHKQVFPTKYYSSSYEV